MAGHRSKLPEDVRFRVLRLLQENPEISQRDLAATVGIGVGSVHYLLGALVEKGLIKLGNFSTADYRRRYTYLLAPKGASEKAALIDRLLRRKLEEFEALQAEIESLQEEMTTDDYFARFPKRLR